jgi:hypothetical protein
MVDYRLVDTFCPEITFNQGRLVDTDCHYYRPLVPTSIWKRDRNDLGRGRLGIGSRIRYCTLHLTSSQCPALTNQVAAGVIIGELANYL